MKTLYITRHAKAEDSFETQSDFERNLTPKGIQDAQNVGSALYLQNISLQKIYSSPAYRTKQTATILAEKLGINPENILYQKDLYDATHSDFLNVVNHLDNQYDSVMIVGHNPSCTLIADFFCTSGVDFLPTCAIICLEFPFDDWKMVSGNTGTLKWSKTSKDWD
jgi:phosphohistidine phosphatase